MPDIKGQLTRLNKTSKKSVAFYHRFALSIGVSDSALGVLYALLEAPSPCSQYDLNSEWSIPKQTINSAVAALQKKGLVSLAPIPGTRNKKSIGLTDTGREFAKKTVSKLRDAELCALAEFTVEERELYIRLNQKYNELLAGEFKSLLAGSDQERQLPNVKGDIY